MHKRRCVLLEFTHIAYFVETCNHTSLSKAAGSLFISQQALSRVIANLEKELGCALFMRSVRGIELTDNGRYLYEQFQPVVTAFKTRPAGRLSISATARSGCRFAAAPVSYKRLAGAAAVVQRAAPQYRA
jgi:DNA-binding transcriptional LysR family regulator